MSDKVNLKRYKGDVYLFDNSTTKQKQPPHDRFLRLNDVKDRVGLSHCTIYRKIREGSFPAQIKIGVLSVWSEQEVIAWMEAQKTGGDQ